MLWLETLKQFQNNRTQEMMPLKPAQPFGSAASLGHEKSTAALELQ
jgi:hypothetical protein